MEALVLSCGTGGGHNSAGQAVADALKRRGHTVTFMDPYQLVGEKTAGYVGDAYIRLVQASPKLFGMLYSLGESYRKLPVHSPVYWINEKMAEPMKKFLRENYFDVIVMSHMYPAHMLTNLKNCKVAVPKTLLIATDYTCSPFMEETDCDYYVIPSSDLKEEFVARGIPQEKLLPFGIPVREEFLKKMSKEEARRALGLALDKKYLLLSGGSIGVGKIEEAVEVLTRFLKENLLFHLVVICGKNQRLYQKLNEQYKEQSQISVLESTTHMVEYIKACDLFITKPGGLSSTEAAVCGVPLMQMSPIPGCETHNVDYFVKRKMSVLVQKPEEELLPLLHTLLETDLGDELVRSQHTFTQGDSVFRLCDFIEHL